MTTSSKQIHGYLCTPMGNINNLESALKKPLQSRYGIKLTFVY